MQLRPEVILDLRSAHSPWELEAQVAEDPTSTYPVNCKMSLHLCRLMSLQKKCCQEWAWCLATGVQVSLLHTWEFRESQAQGGPPPLFVAQSSHSNMAQWYHLRPAQVDARRQASSPRDYSRRTELLLNVSSIWAKMQSLTEERGNFILQIFLVKCSIVDLQCCVSCRYISFTTLKFEVLKLKKLLMVKWTSNKSCNQRNSQIQVSWKIHKTLWFLLLI